MWIRLTARGHRFFFIAEPLAFIRRHPANMSKNAPRMKRNSQLVLTRAWRSGAVSRLAVPFWLRVFAVHYFLVAWTHFDDGLRLAALRYWLASVALWPLFLRPRTSSSRRFSVSARSAIFSRENPPRRQFARTRRDGKWRRQHGPRARAVRL